MLNSTTCCEQDFFVCIEMHIIVMLTLSGEGSQPILEEVDAAEWKESRLHVRLTWDLLLSYLSGSHLRKQIVHECDFVDKDSRMVKEF